MGYLKPTEWVGAVNGHALFVADEGDGWTYELSTETDTTPAEGRARLPSKVAAVEAATAHAERLPTPPPVED